MEGLACLNRNWHSGGRQGDVFFGYPGLWLIDCLLVFLFNSDGLKDMLQSCERAIERLKIDVSYHMTPTHDSHTSWRHDMEPLSALLPLCEGNPVTSGFPSQRDNNVELWYFFVVSMNKLLLNSRVAGGLRRHCCQCGVTVMSISHKYARASVLFCFVVITLSVSRQVFNTFFTAIPYNTYSYSITVAWKPLCPANVVIMK